MRSTLMLVAAICWNTLVTCSTGLDLRLSHRLSIDTQCKVLPIIICCDTLVTCSTSIFLRESHTG